MAKISYLRFNPENREIELEGTEEFIKAYFDKLQQMLPQAPVQAKASEAVKVLPVKNARIKAKAAASARTKARDEIPTLKKTVKVTNKKSAAKKPKKVSLIDQIVGLVQDSETGMTTAEMKDKTGMTPKQIHAITSRAAKLGRIKTTKRGVYVPV